MHNWSMYILCHSAGFVENVVAFYSQCRKFMSKANFKKTSDIESTADENPSKGYCPPL